MYREITWRCIARLHEDVLYSKITWRLIARLHEDYIKITCRYIYCEADVDLVCFCDGCSSFRRCVELCQFSCLVLRIDPGSPPPDCSPSCHDVGCMWVSMLLSTALFSTVLYCLVLFCEELVYAKICIVVISLLILYLILIKIIYQYFYISIVNTIKVYGLLYYC